MSAQFVCQLLSQPDASGAQSCQTWVEVKPNVFDELNALSRADANQVLIEIIGFWLLCWAYSSLANFIYPK